MAANFNNLTSLHFVMSTSTPNSNSNSTTSNPAILNLSDPNDTSFNSVLSGVPLNNLNNIPELHGSSENSGTSLKKKLYSCIILLLLGGCLSVLIYLCLRIDGVVSLAGEYSLDIPGIGGFGASFKVKEVFNLSASLSGQLAKMEPKAPFLWNQTYLNLEQSYQDHRLYLS